MAPNDPTPAPTPASAIPASVPYTVTISEDERQVLLMALGALLQSVERGEHLVSTIQSLLDRIQRAPVQA